MNIITPDKKILEAIYRQFLDQIQDKIAAKVSQIQDKIKAVNLSLWKQTKTYDSLINGDLNHEFGFPRGEAQARVDSILERISKSMIITPKKFSKSGVRKVGLTIRILRNPIHSAVYDMPEATIETKKDIKSKFSDDFASFSGGQSITGGDTAPRKELHWLVWLLKEGNKFIILNYRYEDVVDPDSRSGRGLMIPDETSSWRVPAEFSGTSTNNWLTKTLTEDRAFIASEYGRIINEVIGS